MCLLYNQLHLVTGPKRALGFLICIKTYTLQACLARLCLLWCNLHISKECVKDKSVRQNLCITDTPSLTFFFNSFTLMGKPFSKHSSLSFSIPFQAASFRCREWPFSTVSPPFAIFDHLAPCCPTISSLQRHFGPPTGLRPFDISHPVLLMVHLLSNHPLQNGKFSADDY